MNPASSRSTRSDSSTLDGTPSEYSISTQWHLTAEGVPASNGAFEIVTTYVGP
jgi:hypothetical protein